MARRKRIWQGVLVGLFLAASVRAQAWTVGATVGLVDDVKRHVRLDEFQPRDVNLWVDYEIEEKVQLRGAFGTLKTKGVNAGQSFTLPGQSTPTVMPDLNDKIDYATVGASYQFWEGYYTSGLFAGIGGYKIRPEAAPAAIANFRDQRETAFGWHLGVDGSLKIVSRVAVTVRLTYHNIRATVTKPLVTANAGLSYRF